MMLGWHRTGWGRPVDITDIYCSGSLNCPLGLWQCPYDHNTGKYTGDRGTLPVCEPGRTYAPSSPNMQSYCPLQGDTPLLRRSLMSTANGCPKLPFPRPTYTPLAGWRSTPVDRLYFLLQSRIQLYSSSTTVRTHPLGSATEPLRETNLAEMLAAR